MKISDPIKKASKKLAGKSVSSTDNRATAQKSDNGAKSIKFRVPGEKGLVEEKNALVFKDTTLEDVLKKFNLPMGPKGFKLFRPLLKEDIIDYEAKIYDRVKPGELVELIPRADVA
jgi:hypothetical protein